MSLAALSPQLPLELPLQPTATFDQYVAGDNSTAVEATRLAAIDPSAPWPLLFGGASVGKSHLLTAACHLATAKGRQAMLLSSEVLNELGADVLAELDGIDVLAIDDVDHLLGSADWDEALFHCFNRLRQTKATLLMSGRTDLAALQPSLPDLRSRLSWGLALRLEPLTESDRIVVLRQRAHLAGMTLSDEVINYLLRRVSRDLGNLVTLLDRIGHASLIEQRRITIPFLREQLPKLQDEPSAREEQ